MLSTSSDIQKESLLIVQDGNKFYSRLLSNESSTPNPSFRVYYGVASGAVPFQWESQPGTPKHVSSGTTLPPLTPPPSYYSTTTTTTTTTTKSSKLKPSRSLNLVHAILPSLSLKKSASHAPSPSSTPTSGGSLSPISSPSSSSSFSSAASARRRCRRSSSLSFSSSRREDEESDAGSPTSSATLCFGRLMKSVLLSIAAGHGSRHGPAAA